MRRFHHTLTRIIVFFQVEDINEDHQMENETDKDEECEVNTNKVDQSEDDTLIISTKMEDEDQLDYEGEANTSDF